MSEQPPAPTGGIAIPDPDEVASHSFPHARRGLDGDAVRRYLAELAEKLRLARRAEQSLHAELTAMRSGARPADLSEAALSNAVGAETARVLTAAHEAAHDIVTNAERRASSLVRDAEAAVAEATHAAEAEAADVLARSRAEAAAFLDATREQCRAMVDEARDARRRILADLVERRRSLHVQLEQLRAGRDSLSEMVNAVSGSVMASVQAVRARLDHAEEHARDAAAEAGRDAAMQDDVLELDALVASDLDDASLGMQAGLPDEPSLLAGFPPEPIDPSAPTVESSTEGVIEDEAVDAVREEAPPLNEGRSEAPSQGANDAPSGENPIDQLFARIRASRDEEVAHAHTVLAELGEEAVPPAEVSSDTVPPAEGAPSAAPEASVPSTPAEPEDIDPPAGPARPSRARRQRRGGGSETGEVATLESSEEVDSDEFAILVRRDQLLGPAAAELGRSLKRTLRLEQNELLDALRNLRKTTDRAALLPGDPMADRLVEASIGALDAAYRAGLVFVAEVTGAPDDGVSGSPPMDDKAVREIANALAREIVEPIRRRVDAGLDEGGDEEGASGTVVGAAFRDWRGSRVEGVAGDFVARAFAHATRAGASQKGLLVSWLVDDGESRCPDCDDNALAGAQEPGEPFPTGHVDPPVHPGCRCLLVPITK